MSTPTLTATAGTRARTARRGLRGRIQIVAPELRIAQGPSATVLRIARTRGPLSRDSAAKDSGLSIATVNRQVTSLIELGVLRERADLVAHGAVGRPRIPFEVNHEPYLGLGIHIGAVATSIVAADIRGRILGSVELPTPAGNSAVALAAIARSATSFASRWHKRRPLAVGVAIGGRVDSATGVVDHPRLGWAGAEVGSVIGAALGLPVSVAAHVEAMAASELLLGAGRAEFPTPGTTGLYFYARETAGIAITFEGKVHTPVNGPGSIAHLPTGSSAQCACGAVGCLEATVSDRAVLAHAVRAGVVPEGARPVAVADVYKAAAAGSIAAQDILVDRARVLGRTVALLRDVFNPDRVILGGQAFTDHPAGIPYVAQAFSSASSLERRDIRITGFGNRVQEYASTVVALSALFADPAAAVRRARLL